MDRRLHPRADANLPATIAQLGSDAPPMRATVANISDQGVGLMVETAIPAGALIRIDIEDAVLLGEVVHCRATQAGFAAGVHVRHALYGVSELTAVAERFADLPPERRADPEAAVPRIGG